MPTRCFNNTFQDPGREPRANTRIELLVPIKNVILPIMLFDLPGAIPAEWCYCEILGSTIKFAVSASHSTCWNKSHALPFQLVSIHEFREEEDGTVNSRIRLSNDGA